MVGDPLPPVDATAVQPAVVLVFPPLVESNFGRYFPSTAVLAAYLEEAGIPALQIDLNEELALHLLREEVLERIVERRPPPFDGAGSAMGVEAAGWIRQYGELLFEDGRHAFEPESPHGHALEALAQPLLVDPTAAAVRELHEDPPPAASWYTELYRETQIAARIPASTALVGISVPMGPQLVPSLILAHMLRLARPDLRILLGGPALSLLDSAEIDGVLARHPAVDAIVRFDGEIPLLRLVEQARRGDWQPDGVPGVSIQVDGSIVHVPPAPGVPLAQLPFPLYDKELLARLASPALGVTQARGCYWGNCDYCDYVELYKGNRPFRTRRPDQVVDEIEHGVHTYGASRFVLITEAIPPGFARRFCERILERGLEISWYSFAMIDRRFDRDLLDLLRRAGCDHLVIGLETTNTRVLHHVHKSATREETYRFVRDARDVGLNLRVNLIPDLPTTTYEEALEVLRDVEELADAVVSFSIFPFEPTRSSNIGRDPEGFGLVLSDAGSLTGQAQFSMNHLRSVDPAMTPSQRSEIHRLFAEFAERHNPRASLDALSPEELEDVRYLLGRS